MAEAVRQLPRSSFSKRVQGVLGRDWTVAYAFMAPTVILMGGIIAYPFLRALYISFTNTLSFDIGPFVGLKNYRELWVDKFFRRSVGITIRYTVSAVALKVVFGILAAVLLSRLSPRWSPISSLVLLPWIMPSIVRAITWRGLVNPLYGVVSHGLVDLGLMSRPPQFLTGINTALPTVIVINLWRGIPFFTINLLAGVKAVDQELYEAAAIDGASSWRQFLHVTLPGLRYVLIVVTLLSTIWTFNDFGLIFLLTGGGPMDATKVYSILAYRYAIDGLRFGPGIAVSMTMVPVLGIFIIVLGKYMMQGRRLYDDSSELDKRGPLAEAAYVVSWPLRMALRLVLGLFWLINDVVERLIAWVGDFLRGSSSDRASRMRRQSWLGRALPGIMLFLLICFELLPFYWIITTAFKTELQITLFEGIYWPDPWTLDQYKALFGPTRNVLVWLKNTITISFVTPVLSTFVASLSAYALTRLHWKGARAFSGSVLVAYLMPGVMMLIPIYTLFTRLRLTNSLIGLMVAYPTFSLPFAIWLMMGFYSSIPEELEAAALIDGCNRFQAFFKIVFPLTKPAMLAVVMFGVTQAWSEFLFAYVMIHSERKMTMPVGLAQMIIGDVLPWGELSAAALVMAIPTVLIFVLGQRFMVAGLTAGAVKGGG